MDLSTKENTAPHALSPSVVSDHPRSVTIEPAPLWQENDVATQVPSQGSDDKSHRSSHGISSLHQSQHSTPSELTISPMSPPDEVLSNNDTPIDPTQPTGSSMKDYVDWYVNVFMSKEQRASWDTAQILDFLESVEAFKAKGQRELINNGNGDTIEHVGRSTPTNTTRGATQ